MTDGNDDNWYPAWGTATAAGKDLEETKQPTPKKKP